MSNKTWQERFAEIIKQFCYEEYGKIYFGKQGEELRAEGVLITIEQFISDLRKRDMEALIGMLPNREDFANGESQAMACGRLLIKIKQLIKNYYEN